MKVVAYSVKSFEKELIAKANKKKHEITLISNSLNIDTAIYAEGKEAVVVFTNDDLSTPVVNRLADLGIKYIATRSAGTDHIDRETAGKRGMKIANVPSYSPESIAEYAVTLAMILARKILPTVDHCRDFDFTIDQHIGFTLSGKKVGLIGFGQIGKAAAKIFNGLGCKVFVSDPIQAEAGGVTLTDLDTLYAQCDIISIHAPLNPSTHYLIDAAAIEKMKPGVMLINTSRGSIIKTEDLMPALENGKIGALGIDVYEFEKGLFFYDHSSDAKKDAIINKLMSYPNVIVSPHQAFLTTEAIQEIAAKTIANLDNWQDGKCVGKACACAVQCRVPAKEAGDRPVVKT